MPKTPAKSSPLKTKGKKVMHEFGQRTLTSYPTGKTVTSPAQAFAIAMSEQRQAAKKQRTKGRPGRGGVRSRSSRIRSVKGG